MQQSLTLNIKNIDDNININRNKTENFDIKDNNINYSLRKPQSSQNMSRLFDFA